MTYTTEQKARGLLLLGILLAAGWALYTQWQAGVLWGQLRELVLGGVGGYAVGCAVKGRQYRAQLEVHRKAWAQATEQVAQIMAPYSSSSMAQALIAHLQEQGLVVSPPRWLGKPKSEPPAPPA